MRKINKPTFSVKDVLTDCIDNVSSKKLKDALLNALDTIEDAERDFDLKKISNELSLIPQHIAVNAIVNESTLKSIYTDRMVNKQNKGRVHYDNIFLSAPNGICPLCSQRIVATLDHYLPKSLYPILSVSLHISVIPTQRFRSYPPSVFTDTWLSFANLLFLSQTLSFNIKTM